MQMSSLFLAVRDFYSSKFQSFFAEFLKMNSYFSFWFPVSVFSTVLPFSCFFIRYDFPWEVPSKTPPAHRTEPPACQAGCSVGEIPCRARGLPPSPPCGYWDSYELPGGWSTPFYAVAAFAAACSGSLEPALVSLIVTSLEAVTHI